MAHSAVPLDSTDHEGLDVHHTGPAGFHCDHIEAFANQTVTRYKGSLLTLGEGAGLAGQRCSEEEEEEEGHGGAPRVWGSRSDHSRSEVKPV